MSQRSRASRVRQHVHCDSCYSRRCRARVEVSVSCPFAPCRLRCGALFHLCKEEDHLLLCPNVRVPCLNAGYGCPVQLPRSSQAAHLQVCPASVVCCSMEWLRWPTDDTNPNCSVVLHDNVLKEKEGRDEALDVAVALVDQSDLFRRLKLAPLFPELMEEAEEEEEEVQEEKRAEMAVGGGVSGSAHSGPSKGFHSPISVENSLCEETEATKQSLGKVSSLTEMMFGMERGGCAVAEASLESPKQNPKPGEKGPGPGGRGTTGADAEKEDAAAAERGPRAGTGESGLAPWQEGVLERLREELSPQEYNMYVVHHGRMLLAFGHIQACTPREKDFVYGSLEPIPVQTLRSFKIPDSYHYRRRVHLYDTAARAQSETRCVDTSDLGANEDDWLSDEASATLLGYAERAVMGHKISVSKAIDGLFNDVGAQTHSFRSAPFTRKTSLADVMVDRPLRLRLQLQAESVSSRHNRASCVFSFRCGHSFHRREFATHFRNVHGDIQTCLGGWFEQRCPLSYLGCTYTQRRFQPSTHKATVTYNQQLRSFNLCPTLALPGDDSQPSRSSDPSPTQSPRGGEVSLSSLPYEVLCHVAAFLDSFSLSQLALASRLMRQVCSSLLQERGMVTLQWERKSCSGGGATWRAKPVWEFSHLFSSVDSWHMADIPPISAHLKVCPYYETRLPSEPVPLPSMSEKQGSSQERLSLINHFKGNR